MAKYHTTFTLQKRYKHFIANEWLYRTSLYLLRQNSGGPVRGHRRINMWWGTAIVHLMSLSPGGLSLRGVMTLTTQ
jgi:hypothetical protein